jgi:hypothetical protein
MTQYSGATGAGYGTNVSRGSDVEINAAIAATPTDRVRWGPIVAGLFVALSTLAVLTVLGVAVGLTAWDPGERARDYGWGAAIWSGVSALIAFFVGGLVAARSAAVRGTNNGLLNGFMVWATAIPLMIYLIGGGIGMAATTGARAAGDIASAGANAVGNAASNPQLTEQARREVNQNGGAGNVADQARDAGRQVQEQVQRNLPSSEQAANVGAKAAWGTLIALLLGLAASAVGGLVGARSTHHHHHSDRAAT